MATEYKIIRIRQFTESTLGNLTNLLPRELAITTDTGRFFYCYSAGNIKELATKEDVQTLLNSSPEAWAALQQLITELESETVLTGLLNDIVELQSELNTAKGTFENLGGRLNASDVTLNNMVYEKNDRNYSERKPYYTLMDDDGRIEFLTILKPQLDSRGLKCAVAINPGYIGTAGYMTWNDIADLKTQGFEILNHGWKHVSPGTLTLDQIRENYVLEKQAFIDNGLDTYDYFVYPGTMDWTDDAIKNNLQKVYKCCFANTDAPKNFLPFDNFAIKRPYIASETAKADIDAAIDYTGYCPLFGHSWMSNYSVDALESVLDYILSRGADITYATASDMVNNFKTIIDLGNGGGDYFRYDRNGFLNFSISGKNLYEIACVNFASLFNPSKSIIEYRKNSENISRIGYGNAISIGLPETGTIKTYRFDGDNSDYHCYQEYTCSADSSLWRRKWLPSLNRWDYFFFPFCGVNTNSANRPKYAYQGTSFFDNTLSAPVWAKRTGYNVSHTTVARNTAYSVGQYIDIGGSAIFVCTVAGTTASLAPTYNNSIIDSLTVDGTATFKYIGLSVQWVNATGTLV